MKRRTASPAHPALAHLAKADPVLFAALRSHADALGGVRAARVTRASLFASLVGSVAGQQLSVKAAASIRARLDAACGGRVTPEAIVALSHEGLRTAGLSNAKAKAITGLAEAVQEGRLDLLSLKRLPEDEAVELLSSFWGIGRWTAEMFLMFALGREDVFSPGDLGLRRAVEALYGLPKDCPAARLEEVARRWSPYRSYASRALWRIRDA